MKAWLKIQLAKIGKWALHLLRMIGAAFLDWLAVAFQRWAVKLSDAAAALRAKA